MDVRLLTAIACASAGCLALGAVAYEALEPGPSSAPPPETPLLISAAPSAPISTGQQVALAPAPSNLGRPVDAPLSPAQEEPAPAEAPSVATPETPPTTALPPSPPPRVEVAPPPSPDANAAPPPQKPHPKPVDHRYDGVLTLAEIGRIKAALRLSPDQQAYWPPVAALLRELGQQQMAQIRAGQKPTYDMSSDMSSRFYAAAGPLLGTLREDQRAEVRRRAKMMGLESVASFI